VKRDGLGRTLKAFETGDAVLLAIALRIFLRDCPHRTILHALLAPGAVVGDRSPEESKTGCERKEGSKRAKVTAPESLSHNPQSEDRDENREDEKVHFEEGHRDG
jgi:hypothetical protein